MKNSRKVFKKAICTCKNNMEQNRADAIANALYSDPTKKAFWKSVNRSCSKNYLPATVGGAKGSKSIVKMWKNHYSSLLNSSNNDREKYFVNSHIRSIKYYKNLSNFTCTLDSLGPLMYKLPLNCSAGADKISAEHLIYADFSIRFYLSALFNLCLSHGVIPSPCLDTILVPIVKNLNGNIQDTGNYRPIAVATVISKLLERFILSQISPFLNTSHNQFGFKPKHSTDMSIFLFNKLCPLV